LAHIGRQRQQVPTSTLAAHEKFSCPPVQVVQFERGHLGEAQPETGKQHEHGEIACPTWSVEGSKLSSSLATSAAAKPTGRPVSRQPATDASAFAISRGVRPLTYKNRNSGDRSSTTRRLG
jgi:hypothetical protein